MKFISSSVEETQNIAARLGGAVFPGAVIALWGDLGAGKTAFVRGLAQGMGVSGRVHSPTFAIVHEHNGPIPLFHFDLYRLEDGLEDSGLDEYFDRGGVCALESFALLATSLIMGDPICCIASASLCGAALGFLPYNANRATIFMGDAGSMLIGYIMACISVFGLFKSQALFSIVVPALIFALPVMDTVHAFCRRIARGQNPFKADRQHLHHKLLYNGFTPRQSVVAIYVASAVFCIASVLYMRYPMLSLGLCIVDLVYLEALKNDKKFLWQIKKKRNAAEMASGIRETNP
jgi:tRNA threonylcarbamoyl adenosine modification protein YjeE